MKKKIVAAFVIALLLLAVLAYPELKRRRDLKETLDWIQQTYNLSQGASLFSQGHGWERHYVALPDRTEQLTQEFHSTVGPKASCDVVIHSETSPVGILVDTPSKTDYSFNLRDIDPTSIRVKTFDLHKDVFDCADSEQVQLYKLNCPDAEVYFQTRNGASAVNEESVRTFLKLTGAEQELRSTSELQEAWLIADDVDYAQRLAKAWEHAVELCGGKPSKF